MDLIQEQIYKSTDLNSLDITHIGFDMTDPTIREYNGKMAREAIVHKTITATNKNVIKIKKTRYERRNRK